MPSLLNKVEQAIKAVVDAAGLSLEISDNAGGVTKKDLTVLVGQDNEDADLPSLTIHAAKGEEKVIGLGNYTVSVHCMLRTSAVDTEKDAHEALAEAIFDLLETGDIGARASTFVGDLSILDPIVGRGLSETVRDKSWISELDFECQACRSNVLT